MKVIEPQLEILLIPEAVGLHLEGLDFVDQALDSATGDAVIEEVEKTGAIGRKGLSDSLESFDP